MSLISSAQRATRVVKNVGRMREIVGGLSAFGFGTLVNKAGLGRFAQAARKAARRDDADASQTTPVRVRLLCESLGPTFIKLAQILSGRPDLIPQDFVEEFKKLQDKVPALPFETLRPSLERELGGTLDMFFSSFDTEALASASIAQVHAARTLDGDDVVVKIQKPDVARLLAQDLEILNLLAEAVERYVPELRSFRPKALANEFRRSILQEIDFVQEASNLRRFRENFIDNPFLVVPKVYPGLSTTKVVTLERLRGVKLSDLEAVRSLGIDPKELLRQGMRCFYQSIMVDGLFHGDPHGGNILVLPDGRMALIDFGSVGHLTLKGRAAVINMFLALLNEDYDDLIWEYLQMSPPSSGSRSSKSFELVASEVAVIFSPYHGLPLREIPAGKLLMEATAVAFKNQVSLPRDLVLVFKSIMTLEGLGRQLDPEFDLITAATEFAPQVFKELYKPSRLGKDAMILGRDVSRLLRSAPRQLSEIMRQIESREIEITAQIPQIDRLARAKIASASRLSFAIAASALFLGALFAIHAKDLPPAVASALILTSAVALGWALIKNLRA